MEYRSTSMPNRCAQKVSAIAIRTWPLSAGAVKVCSAFGGASIWSVTARPLGDE
jgi:hypothetical protein